MWRAFLIAARFLTRLPLPDPGPCTDEDLGRSLVPYPLVGLILGLLVWGLALVLAGAYPEEPDLAAALLLVAWVWITGGLHLDGLADTADAWIGGMGDRDRTLEIMKDPNSGPFGVMALVLVLLCKWAAIAALIGGAAAVSLVWIPVLARVQLLALFLTTPYVRPAGLGAGIGAQLPRRASWYGLTLTLGASAFFAGAPVFPLLVVGVGLFALWRWLLMRRLQGFTGDTAGALVELSETLMLVAAVGCSCVE